MGDQPPALPPSSASGQTTFDTRLAYIQSSSSQVPTRQNSYNYPTHLDPSHARTQGPSQGPSRRSSHEERPRHATHPSMSNAPLLNGNAPSALAHPGCVLCGLVRSCGSNPPSPILSPQHDTSLMASSSQTPITAGSFSQSPYPLPFDRGGASSPSPDGRRTGNRVGGRDIVYGDKDITIYKAEGKERLCQDGRHLIIVVNEHLQSVYEFGASDIPLLSHIIDTAVQILNSAASASLDDEERGKEKDKVQVGFVGSLMKDPQSPHAHLHAHAYLPPIDTKLAGATLWRRNVVFGSLNWWSVEDLRAEIREATSNNRVKTGYQHREAPINQVPDAGSTAPVYSNESDYHDTPSPLLAPGPLHRPPSRSQSRSPGASSSKSPPPRPSSHPMTNLAGGSDVSICTVTPSSARGSGDVRRHGKGKASEDFENVEMEDSRRSREGFV
ncbi:hypothetical protein L202_03734 [Cryptococcus amylolentus CBS 6039]|uniref:HIT domain-containing protein n=1 Tax=Cryptococcus amylolentus CBS 6039 TaxID=1295533 RepID=A0A1E3HU06_9TREE|nr:hypothetical protein L202_03734 [Cryptococcus amylolentus CBS 6039]ODN79840.1 hypothetical protein L202_03734 [Cryptococcus amylolentus CBS 6039]